MHFMWKERNTVLLLLLLLHNIYTGCIRQRNKNIVINEFRGKNM